MNARTELRRLVRGRRWRDLWALEASRDWRECILLVTLLVTLPIALLQGWATIGLLAIPLCLTSLLVGPRLLPWLVLLVLVDALVLLALRWYPTQAEFASVGVLVALSAIILTASLRRNTLGIGGLAGEAMLVDLRDRILAQGTIPPLPAGWQVEAELRSAGGTPFAGDFVVAGRTPGSARFDLVLVDVSGKGEQASTRALLLSGALGGLLTAVPAEGFLPAANSFLLRQNWEEGFATAVHLTLDLVSGEYQIRTAGHPPAVLFDSEEERWTELEGTGPGLGWWPSAGFGVRSGVLEPGDAILLYTDGMVETRDRDIDTGIERLEDGATKMLQEPMTTESVRRLVGELGSSEDDRALVAVRRVGHHLPGGG